MGWLWFFGGCAVLFVWSEWDVRGTAAQRLIDRFRLNAKKPEPPRRSLLRKIREARDARAYRKALLRSLRFRPPPKEVPGVGPESRPWQ